MKQRTKVERQKLTEPDHSEISTIRQCQLLGISRSGFYYKPKAIDAETRELMQRIDKIYTEKPYYGYPRITAQLNREQTEPINRKRVARLMRIMGIQAIFPQKNGSVPNPKHSIYPYLLKGINIRRPNQVWGTDITYVRANNTWFYLVAILDWFSRYVISWKLSSSLSTSFCVETLKQALKVALPQIHNSDQGSQFTANEYLDILKKHQSIEISMDGRGRCFDNIFTERLWRTVKYEEIYLKDYQSFSEAKSSLNRYFKTYNDERLHQSLNYQTPAEIYYS